MHPRTRLLHRKIAKLGGDLGFEVTSEASGSVLALKLDAYTPRTDVVWSLRLSRRQADAVASALGGDAASFDLVPIVGFEIEGTHPSTKTLESDVANLAALGAPLGILVVSEAEAILRNEPGIYRRAVRMIRTVRRNFGEQPITPMDASWIPKAAELKRARPRRSRLTPFSTSPRGGERSHWGADVRRRISQMGTDAGFVVMEPYIAPVLRERFVEDAARWELRHTHDPLTGESKPISRAPEWMTESCIDLAWMLRIPSGLRTFLEHVASRDPHLPASGLIRPALYDDVAVVGFELDTTTGKHAAGGFLNLSPYCVTGVTVVATVTGATCLRSALARYQPTLGLRNVRVRTSDEIFGSVRNGSRTARRKSA